MTVINNSLGSRGSAATDQTQVDSGQAALMSTSEPPSRRSAALHGLPVASPNRRQSTSSILSGTTLVPEDNHERAKIGAKIGISFCAAGGVQLIAAAFLRTPGVFPTSMVAMAAGLLGVGGLSMGVGFKYFLQAARAEASASPFDAMENGQTTSSGSEIALQEIASPPHAT